LALNIQTVQIHSKYPWGRTDNAQLYCWQQHMPQWHNSLRQ
jgi:hypothetical protein